MSKASRLGWFGPARGLLLLAACLAVPLLWVSVVSFGATQAALPIALFAGITAMAAHGMRQNFPFPVMGVCNGITLMRAAMICYLAGFAAFPAAFAASGWTVFWVASIALLMDGTDGWFARREGLQSGFGARFDMESDALLGVVLSVLLVTSGTTGPWVLVLGGLRYGFVAASMALPWLGAPLPDSFRRKVICVVQIGTLVLLTMPLLPPALTPPVTFFAVIALIYSFAVDIRWLARQRP